MFQPIACPASLGYHCGMANLILPDEACPLALIEADDDRDLLALDRDKLAALYKAHGALLFRGFDVGVERFGQFCRGFCPTAAINESPGRMAFDEEMGVQSVNLGTDPFPLHPELSREPWKPDAAFFHCIDAPQVGGQTTVCDGIELVRRLPAPLRDALAQHRLIYVMPTFPELFEFWLGTAEPSEAQLAAPPPQCPYEFRRFGDGTVVRTFSRPALHKPMFAGDLAFGNFLLFARFHNGLTDFPLLDTLKPVPEDWLQAIKAAGDAASLSVDWQQGDVLMLDNTRFMHGRRAIDPAGERSIATFFGYLSFAEPDPEEPPMAVWRIADFIPPMRRTPVTPR